MKYSINNRTTHSERHNDDNRHMRYDKARMCLGIETLQQARAYDKKSYLNIDHRKLYLYAVNKIIAIETS